MTCLLLLSSPVCNPLHYPIHPHYTQFLPLSSLSCSPSVFISKTSASSQPLGLGDSQTEITKQVKLSLRLGERETEALFLLFPSPTFSLCIYLPLCPGRAPQTARSLRVPVGV